MSEISNLLQWLFHESKKKHWMRIKEQQSDINFFKQEMTRVIFELIICKLTLLDFDGNKIYTRMKIKITNFLKCKLNKHAKIKW